MHGPDPPDHPQDAGGARGRQVSSANTRLGARDGPARDPQGNQRRPIRTGGGEAAVGKNARRISRRMKKMQGTLGDHHDAVVARDTAPDIGIRGSGKFEAANAGQSEWAATEGR